ncbi:MAG: plasmid mobilization relaxosome protein MobC [Faecalibacterium sp.]
MKDKFINFRASEKEKKQLTILAKKAKMSQADFIRHAIFSKEIVVIDGLKPLQMELKRIGNNLNQLTTRSNMGHFSVIDLQETKEQLGKIHEMLADLCDDKNGQLRSEAEHTDFVYDPERWKIGV